MTSARLSLRTKAERQLASQSSLIHPDEVNHLKLIHELRVHQVELEMQSEELRNSLADAEAVRKKYQDLFELAPVGYLTLSRRGTIFEANKCAANLLNQTSQVLVGRKLRELVRDTSVASLDNFIAAAGESTEDVFVREIALFSPKPFPRFVNMQAHSIADVVDGTRKIRLTMMDVSVLKVATDDIVQAIDRASGFGSFH
jgi:nitrogen fixation/metabolism regulation signal transduction histidine kinase